MLIKAVRGMRRYEYRRSLLRMLLDEFSNVRRSLFWRMYKGSNVKRNGENWELCKYCSVLRPPHPL